MASFFFYGTLLVPSVLVRVIGNDGSHLLFLPCILYHHSRHRVLAQDYPALIPSSSSLVVLSIPSLPPNTTQTVRGTLVSGLTPADIAKLFHFEGDEYGIEEITVAPLSSAWEEIGEYDVRRLEGRRQDRMRREPLACSTFMWIGGLGGLEKESWDLDAFLSEKAHLWSAPHSDDPASHP